MFFTKIGLSLATMATRNLIMNLGQYCCFRKPLRTINLDKRILMESVRLYSEGSKQSNCLAEGKLQDILKKNFPAAEYIEVRDVSGGCGAMFEISVISQQFKGMSIVKQHRLVNEALKEEIKDMHGLRIQTALPGNI